MAAFGSSSVAEFARNATTGVLTQLASPNDCIGMVGSGCGTANATGMEDAFAVAVSPDGKNVYVSGLFSNAVAEFTRNTTTGALTQLSAPNDCMGMVGSGCGTTSAHGLTKPVSLAVSADGSNFYVAAGGTYVKGALAEFTRNASTGALTQLSSPNDCITSEGSDCGTINAHGLEGVEDLVLTPDGNNAYATASKGSSLAEFSRDPSTGALHQLPSPNDCVTSNPTGCGRVSGTGMNGAQGIALSPDSANVYVAAPTSNAIVEFSRNGPSGELMQLSSPNDCTTSASSGCASSNAAGLEGVRRLTVSPDGTSIYSAAGPSSALAEFARLVPPTVAGSGTTAGSTTTQQATTEHTPPVCRSTVGKIATLRNTPRIASIARKRRAKRKAPPKGLAATVTCSKASTVRLLATLTITPKQKKQNKPHNSRKAKLKPIKVTLGSSTLSVAANVPKRFLFTPSKRIVAQVIGAKTASATLSVTATDAAGSVGTATAKVARVTASQAKKTKRRR